ncbi:MAG: hypothetical protein AABZ39_20740 [Spirochaetota bacterium]
MKAAVSDIISSGASFTLRAQAVSGDGRALAPAGTKVNPSIAGSFAASGAVTIDVLSSAEGIAALSRVNPAAYRKPYAVETPAVIDHMCDILERVSSVCERKRYLIAAEDITDAKGKEVLIPYGETITRETWANISRELDQRRPYAYRPNEVGIIVLIDLRPRGDDYLKRFYKNSDLVTTLVGRRDANRLVVSPDMSASDVHVVDSHEELVRTYKGSDTRLVVVGEALSPEYKKALGEIKRFDSYARFMLAVNIDHTQTMEFLKQVALNYHRNPWQKAA